MTDGRSDMSPGAGKSKLMISSSSGVSPQFDTLENLSKPSEGDGGPVTSNKSLAINFDDFVKRAHNYRGLPHQPMSCDALLKRGKWVCLIEFKNQELEYYDRDNKEVELRYESKFKLIRKLYDSAIMLMAEHGSIADDTGKVSVALDNAHGCLLGIVCCPGGKNPHILQEESSRWRAASPKLAGSAIAALIPNGRDPLETIMSQQNDLADVAIGLDEKALNGMKYLYKRVFVITEDYLDRLLAVIEKS